MWLPKTNHEKHLFRPAFKRGGNQTAEEAMVAWEGRGIPLPSHVKNPSKLADYVQGKRLRDLSISMYREDIKAGILFPIELVGTGDFKTIEQVIKAIGNIGDNGRQTQRLQYVASGNSSLSFSEEMDYEC